MKTFSELLNSIQHTSSSQIAQSNRMIVFNYLRSGYLLLTSRFTLFWWFALELNYLSFEIIRVKVLEL